MQRFVVAAAAMAALAYAGPAAARGGGLGEAGEAEAARMHAKAGGPTNYRDAELLERYGCRDKTDSDYCWYLYVKQNGGHHTHHRRHRERAGY